MNLYTFKKTDLCSQPKAFDAKKCEAITSAAAGRQLLEEEAWKVFI